MKVGELPMDKIDENALNTTIALARCAESIAEMNECILAIRKLQNPKIVSSLRDSQSLISQVLQSLEDLKTK